MSRPETFTLQCDRCKRHLEAIERVYAKQYTSHRQATLDGNAAGWRMTSMEEVCAVCVAKESELPPLLRERDPDDFDVEAVRVALDKQRVREGRAKYEACPAESCDSVEDSDE